MLKAERFLAAAHQQLEPLRGTYIREPIWRDHLAKTEQVDAGYGRWLAALIPYLAARAGISTSPRILDFGCGTGEMTVLMNQLGYQAFGIDVHREHLELARLLAEENGVPAERLILSTGGRLPFEDRRFDVATMFVVLEHLSDQVLARVLPELARVCGGPLFIQVPNRWQVRDDHTGLAFVPWMPNALARLYVRARGPHHRYAISRDGSWDVWYRGPRRIRRDFARHGYRIESVPDALVYPPLAEVPPLFEPRPQAAWKRASRAVARGWVQVFEGPGPHARHPFLNLIAMPVQGAR
jgi:SAM-dependent methyltransferase